MTYALEGARLGPSPAAVRRFWGDWVSEDWGEDSPCQVGEVVVKSCHDLDPAPHPDALPLLQGPSTWPLPEDRHDQGLLLLLPWKGVLKMETFLILWVVGSVALILFRVYAY